VIAVGMTVVGLIAVLIPLIWAVLGSLKTEAEFREIPVHLIPRNPTLEAYAAVLGLESVLDGDKGPGVLAAGGRLPRSLLNSTIVTTIEVLSVVTTSSLAGYVFARKRFWGKEAVFLFVLASMMVPFSMLLIPLYLLFVDLGLNNNYVGVILPTAISPYGIFLCRQFIRGIPQELFDSAMIDGASDVQIYLKLVLPLTRPVLSALAIFAMIASLNSLLWPLVVLADAELFTLPLALATYIRQGEAIIFTQILAAAVLGSLPMVVAFLVFQRNFVQGISLTGFGGR